MSPEPLIEAVSEASPAGVAVVYLAGYLQLVPLADYLHARLALGECERLARLDYQGENAESDQRTAQANVADARRRLDLAESAAKEVLGRAPSLQSAREELRDRAARMLRETGKDLHLVQQLTLAWLLEEGLPGLARGLQLAEALLERHGAEVWPRPDEDDPQDVSERANVLAEMLNGEPMLAALRECTVLEAPGLGRLSGRDVEVIDGRLDDDQGGGVRSVPELAAVAQALGGGTAEGAATVLRQAQVPIDACEAAVEALARRFQAGTLRGERVPRLLQRLRALLQAAQPDAPQADADGGAPQPGVIAPIVTRPAAGGGAAGPLRTREDARHLILQICKFLEATEPSHPAPLFLRRAERLLRAKDFFAIVRDMAPDAMSELERITGQRDESDSN